MHYGLLIINIARLERCSICEAVHSENKQQQLIMASKQESTPPVIRRQYSKITLLYLEYVL